MTGTFTPINSPVFTINSGFQYNFDWIWPQGQTVAHITVEYEIQDSSNPQQTLIDTETITINRPIPQPQALVDEEVPLELIDNNEINEEQDINIDQE
jgi:hypothetical protein